MSATRCASSAAETLCLASTGRWRRACRRMARNLVLKAARLCVDPAARCAITLDKHLPPCCGHRRRIVGRGGLRCGCCRALWDVPLTCDVLGAGRGRARLPDATARSGCRAWAMPEPGARAAGLRHRAGQSRAWRSRPPRGLRGAVVRATIRPMTDSLPEWPSAEALADWLATQRNDLQSACGHGRAGDRRCA